MVFSGLPPLSNPTITIEIANTDFSAPSEYVAQVLVGGIVLGVNYLTEGGEDDNCAKLTKIVDGQVAPYGAVTAEGNLTVSILASKWVGSWTCTDGSTLFAKVSICDGTPLSLQMSFRVSGSA